MLMHGDFLKKNPNVKCSYDTYRNTLHDMKITITNLGHEECELCTNYKHSDPEHYTNDNKDLSSSKCLEYTDHLKRAKEAREKYQSDAAQYKDKNNVSCVSADLQKVIMLRQCSHAALLLSMKVLFLWGKSPMKNQSPSCGMKALLGKRKNRL